MKAVKPTKTNNSIKPQYTLVVAIADNSSLNLTEKRLELTSKEFNGLNPEVVMSLFMHLGEKAYQEFLGN